MLWKGSQEKREVASRGREWARWLVRDFGDGAEAELERRLAETDRSALTRAIYRRARRELRRIRRRAAPPRLTIGRLLAAAARLAVPSRSPRARRRRRRA